MNKHQKFQKGDLVHISKNLGSSMEHFESDQDVVIVGSYYDEYGGDPVENGKEYIVRFSDGNEVAWYFEDQLTLVTDRLEMVHGKN